MEESDRCCGFGGVFSLRMPEVSTAMTAEKLRQAAATGAQTLVTADPGCLMQMRQLAADDQDSIQHLAVVLEEMTR
jgi:L-lactate dehydrogenase complex protein LldE